MIRRRTATKSSPAAPGAAPTRPHGSVIDWVLSLPWVIERPEDRRWPSVRVFAIECPPLDRQRMLLVMGVPSTAPDGTTYDTDVAAVMPVAAAFEADAAGWEVHGAPTSPAGQVLVTLARDATHERDDIEALVLAAYGHAMA